jgi:C-terminal processing protease CtpA/Prc
MKKYLILFALGIIVTVKGSSQINKSSLELNPKSIITKEQLLKDKIALKKYHPNPFNSLPESEWDSLINVFSATLPKNPIRESEKMLIRRKILDKITYEDPHLRFLPVLGKKGTKLTRKLCALPFNLINISDTLIVDKSFDLTFKKGDRILSVNGVDIDDYLSCSYRDRYMFGYTLQVYHHFSFANEYNVILEREGKKIKVLTKGITLNNSNVIKMQSDVEANIISNKDIGYFAINNFNYNKYLFKRLSKFLEEMKKLGYKNIILDLRKNTGGNGDGLDNIFSLFTSKDILPYLKNTKLKVSNVTCKDYSCSNEDIGKTINLPDEYVVKEFPLDESLYKGKFNFYILISKHTASMAATFANIMQYNKIGLLVGEPLAHNALNYGETITAERDNSFWTISTVEYLEYTNAENGILKPDIAIPFVASEYMKGGDPVLEHCLELIKAKSKE